MGGGWGAALAALAAASAVGATVALAAAVTGTSPFTATAPPGASPRISCRGAPTCTTRALQVALPAGCRRPCLARCGYAGDLNPFMRTPFIWTRRPRVTGTGTLNTFVTTTTPNTITTTLMVPPLGLGVAAGVRAWLVVALLRAAFWSGWSTHRRRRRS